MDANASALILVWTIRSANVIDSTLAVRTRTFLLVCAVLATSSHRFQNDFVFDDVAMILEGEVIHDLSNLPAAWTNRTMFASAADDGSVDSVDTYRPLTVTTFFLDAAWSGRSPFGYHLTGLLLHLLATLGVFGVGRRAFADLDAATFGALVFAVHPWLVEAHVWINGRSDSLALCLALASAFAFLGTTRHRHLLAGVAFLGALLAKETALPLLPALALLPTHGVVPPTREVGRRVAVLAIGAATYLVVRFIVLDGARAGSEDTLVAALRVLPILLADAGFQTVAPHDVALRSMRDEYETTWWLVSLAWLAIASTALTVWASRHRPGVVAASLWFFAPLIPVAVVATVLWPGFGRYLYLGMPGFVWLLGMGFSRARVRWPRASTWVAGFYALALGLQTFSAVRDWRDDVTLYTAAIEAAPDSAMGYGWMGLTLAKRGRDADAIPYLEQAVLRDAQTHRYLARLGQALHATGRLDDAAAIAARGIHSFRGRPEEASYRMLAARSLTTPSPDLVVGHLLRCLEVWPGRTDCMDALETLRADPAHAAAIRRAEAAP